MLLVVDISLTSLRVRRFRNSRAIFSSVVPRFLGVGGITGDFTLGDAGSGLLMVAAFVSAASAATCRRPITSCKADSRIRSPLAAAGCFGFCVKEF